MGEAPEATALRADLIKAARAYAKAVGLDLDATEADTPTLLAYESAVIPGVAHFVQSPDARDALLQEPASLSDAFRVAAWVIARAVQH
jgi:hypothetical protein